MTSPIRLRDSDFVAAGGGRMVFQHPERPELLIKVLRPERLVANGANRDKWLRRLLRPLSRAHRRFGPYREWFLEHEEYIAILNRTRTIPDFVAGYHGFVDTDRGLGMIVERITAPNGAIAPTLHKVLRADGEGMPLAPLIDALFDRVGAARAVLKDVTTRNIVLGVHPHDRSLRLVVVDGLSDPTVLRVKTWSQAAYRHWLARHRAELRARVGSARCAGFEISAPVAGPGA